MLRNQGLIIKRARSVLSSNCVPQFARLEQRAKFKENNTANEHRNDSSGSRSTQPETRKSFTTEFIKQLRINGVGNSRIPYEQLKTLGREEVESNDTKVASDNKNDSSYECARTINNIGRGE